MRAPEPEAETSPREFETAGAGAQAPPGTVFGTADPAQDGPPAADHRPAPVPKTLLPALFLGGLVWGALVVSQIDNFIRPLVISATTEIPFLLVLIGVLGGLLAFGLIGLFLGPIVLAILLAVWREWAENMENEPGSGEIT